MPGASISTNALQAQINALGESMANGLCEIKTMLQGIDQRVRTIETQAAGAFPLVNLRLEKAEAMLGDHAAQIRELQNLVKSLATMRTILVWALGLLTVVLGAILTALATGKAAIVFR